MGIDERGKFKGRIKSTGLRPEFMVRLHDLGIDLPGEIFEKEI